MPIHKPGEKFRHSRLLKSKHSKREVVAILSLTAMVDMFTVLVVFLLQNYNATGQVLYIPKEVTLPKAEQIKELKPAVVVTISEKEILIDRTPVVSTSDLRGQTEWMIQPLYIQLVEALKKSKEDFELNLQQKLKEAVTNNPSSSAGNDMDWNKVTIQADKGMDFLTIKKVMYTVTEAGAGEINFAVNKEAVKQ